MTHTTLPTIQAVLAVHRAQHLLQNAPLTPNQRKDLTALTNGVLSFTAYYLRFANPECRPSQLQALHSLINLIDQLEHTHGNTQQNLELVGHEPDAGGTP